MKGSDSDSTSTANRAAVIRKTMLLISHSCSRRMVNLERNWVPLSETMSSGNYPWCLTMTKVQFGGFLGSELGSGGAEMCHLCEAVNDNINSIVASRQREFDNIIH
jgi:hypothetical protein